MELRKGLLNNQISRIGIVPNKSINQNAYMLLGNILKRHYAIASDKILTCTHENNSFETGARWLDLLLIAAAIEQFVYPQIRTKVLLSGCILAVVAKTQLQSVTHKMGTVVI